MAKSGWPLMESRNLMEPSVEIASRRLHPGSATPVTISLSCGHMACLFPRHGVEELNRFAAQFGAADHREGFVVVIQRQGAHVPGGCFEIARLQTSERVKDEMAPACLFSESLVALNPPVSERTKNLWPTAR